MTSDAPSVDQVLARRTRAARAIERDAPGPTDARSLFIPLGTGTRIALLFYLVAYRLVFPIAAALTTGGSKDLLDLRILAEIYYTSLIAFPFIFYRREYGWLHPLVLPTVFMLAKAVVKNPLSLLFPFDLPLVDFTVETTSNAAVLSLPVLDLAWARLELSLIYCLAQSVYLAFFLFGPTFRIPRIAFYRPSSVALPAMVFIGALGAMAAYFVLSHGGLSGVILGMREGRRALTEGSGHLVVATTLAPMIAVAWFMYEKRPWTNPLLLGGLAVAMLSALITSGSRGALILPMLTLIMLWWWRKGRALIAPTFLAAFIALFLIGGFGSIRQDWGSRTIDLSVFDPANFRSTLDLALADIKGRDDQEGGLAVVVSASEKGLLWGKSYANATTFWVPRVLWKDKPAGVDVYNMWINFNGNSINSRPPQIGTWGTPVSAPLEAYWNLWLPGVAVLFALMGMFHATLAKAAHVYRTVPIFWVFYINTLLTMTGTSKELITVIEQLATLAAFAFFAGILRFDGTMAKRLDFKRVRFRA
jgi:hypothetical protein